MSHVAAVAVLALLGLVAATAPAHAAGRPGSAVVSRVAVADVPDPGGREPRAASGDRQHLAAAVADVVDDVVGAVHRTRADVAASLAFQQQAVTAWWSASAPGWVRDAARVGPALWDLGRSVGDLARSQAVQWLSWITDDARVAR